MTAGAPVHTWRRASGVPLLLVHGFAGHGESWADVAEMLPADRTIASLTLPGHDPASPIARGDGFEATLEHIGLYIKQFVGAPCDTAGYSMGGRIVLGLLVRHPELVRSAVLIGANPGIETEEERAERARWDRAWAELLVADGIEAFADRWEKLPLFETQAALPPDVAARQRAIRLRHDPESLAAALLALGLSAMPNYWPMLPCLRTPVRLVAGEMDEKFRAVAERMATLLPRAEVVIVPGAGHNVPLERPDLMARELHPGPNSIATS